MKNTLLRSALGLSSIVFIVIVIGHIVITAQAPITGNWTADARTDRGAKAEDADKIQLNFERRTAHGENQNGQSYAYSDLSGLTRDQTQNGKVSFRIVREAGTVDCEGSFTNGHGSGTFTFTPDRNYVEAMRSRGFDFDRSAAGHDSDVDDRLLSAALLNVTTELADDLKSEGFATLDTEDLFKAAIFKVDSRYIAEMKAAGFPNLTMEDLVKARIFKIDADYVRQIHDMGFENKDMESLVKFRIFKVTPEYLSALKAEGLTNLSSEQVVQCRIFNIDPEFVRKAKAEDPNVTVEQLVQMKIGVHRTRESI